MAQVKQRIYVDLEEDGRLHEGPDQEKDETREASSPVVLVVLCMFLSFVATVSGVAAGRF
jgi:hypothetical protein